METLAEKIVKAIEKYHVGFMKKKVLKTVEEVEANTDAADKYIAGAGVAGELINNLMSGLGGNKLIYNESEDAYYIQHGADAALKKLGDPDADSDKFFQYYTDPGKSNTYYLPDGIYIYFALSGQDVGNIIEGSIYNFKIQTNSINFAYYMCGICDTSKSNIVKQNPVANTQSATVVFYKLSN